MSGYVHGASAADLAAAVDRQRTILVTLERRAAEATARADGIMTAANQAARKIITEAITQADQIRANAKVTAEHEASRIRERAYLEGRVLADAQRIEHDKQHAGDTRRAMLKHELARR